MIMDDFLLYVYQESVILDGVIKSHIGRREVDLLRESAGFSTAEYPFHPAVFPFDGQRAVIPDLIQCTDNVVEINIAVAGGNA